jgi:hypothetical protein
MIVDLPHVGPWNIDRIVRVTAHRARWHSEHKPRVTRDYIWWGKIRRDRGLWSWYESARIRVWTGSGYDDYIEYPCKPGEPERLRAEVLAAIAAAHDIGPERIVAAAVRRLDLNRAWTPADGDHTRNWMTYTMPAPARHHNILHSMPPAPDGTVLNVEQGFITSTGRWVDRHTAMGIAVAAGQVDPSKVRMPQLFSEDLW